MIYNDPIFSEGLAGFGRGGFHLLRGRNFFHWFWQGKFSIKTERLWRTLYWTKFMWHKKLRENTAMPNIYYFFEIIQNLGLFRTTHLKYFSIQKQHDLSSAVISIKHVSTFVNKVENPYVTTMIFDLIDKCRYVFYGYDGSLMMLKIDILESRWYFGILNQSVSLNID